MPTYEYACAACGHQWEQVQRIVEAPIELCPKCANKSAHRLISGGTNFILKGGGWYSDLYSSSKPGAKEPGAKAPESGNSSESGSKSSDGGSKAEGPAKGDTKATQAASSTASTPSSSAPSSPPASS